MLEHENCPSGRVVEYIPEQARPLGEQLALAIGQRFNTPKNSPAYEKLSDEIGQLIAELKAVPITAGG